MNRMLATIKRAATVPVRAIGAGVVMLLSSALAAAQAVPPSCPIGTPVTFAADTYSPYGANERLFVRSGASGLSDWEWGLGAETGSLLTSVRGHTNWVSGRVYSYTLTYNENGTGRIVVRDGGTTLVDRSYNNVLLPLRSGNALRLSVTSAAGIGVNNRIGLTVDTVNGAAVSATLQTAGDDTLSEQQLVLASASLGSGFVATGTLTLDFTGASPPSGSALSAAINAGNIVCRVPGEERVTQVVPEVFSLQAGAAVNLTAHINYPLLEATTITFASSNASAAGFNGAPSQQVVVPAGATQASAVLTGVGAGNARLTATLANGNSASSAVSVLTDAARLAQIQPGALVLDAGATAEAQALLDRVANTDTPVTLATTPGSLVTTPPTIVVPAGQQQQAFTVTGDQPGAGTLAANAPGSAAQAGAAVIGALPVVADFGPALSAAGVGAEQTLTLRLSAVQNTDTVVSVSTAQPGLLSVPAQVTVPAGQIEAKVVVRGLAAGNTTVSASVNGPTRSVTVAIAQVAPALAFLTPVALSIEQGASTQLEIHLAATSTSDTEVTLSNIAPGRLTYPATAVIPAGATRARVLLTANTQGADLLTVRLGALTLPAVVNVSDSGPNVLPFLPSTVSLARGQTREHSINLNKVTGIPRVLTLSSTAPTVLQVPAEIVVPAGSSSVAVPLIPLAEGTSTLQVTYGGTTRNLTVNVGSPVPVGVSLSRTSVQMPVGAQEPLSLRTHFSDGSLQDSTSSATWSSSANGIATVSNGNVTAVAPGSATVTATLNDYVATASITVGNESIPLAISAPGTVVLNSVSNVTISLPAAAPADTTINLAASGGVFAVPTSVVIPAGSPSATIALTATSIGSGTLVASGEGFIPASANIMVIPAPGPSITSISPTSGQVMTTVVTITGVNFNDIRTQNIVTFTGPGSTRLTAVVLSATPTELTARVPFGSVTGAVQVETPLGSAAGPVFTVVSDQEVGFTASPVDVTVYQGSNAVVALSLDSLGSQEYQGLMELSLDDLPDGVEGEFSPTHLSNGQSGSLILTASGSAPAVTAQNVTITATNLSGGSITARSATVRVSVAEATGVTGVKGRFITPEGAGIAGFRVAVQDNSGTLLAQTSSDAAGNFMLTSLPSGSITLRMDGTPVNPLYPIWPYTIDLPGNTILTLKDWTITPPPTDDNYVAIDNATQDQIVTDERYPGLEITLPAGVQIIGYDGVPKTRVAVSRISPDKLPTVPPPIRTESIYQLYFGSPMGGIPTARIPVKVPNDLGLEPGEKTELWYFDGMPIGGSGEWRSAGLGTVSSDGQTISSDEGNGIPRFCGVCGLFCFADNQDRSPNPPCDDCDGPQQSEGKPVNLATGQELDSAVDLVLDGDPAIVISREYNPFDAFAFIANYTQSMGVNWSFNYDVVLMPFNDGEGDIRLVMPGNQRFSFAHVGGGEYKATTGPLMMQGNKFRRVGGASPTSGGPVPLIRTPEAGSAGAGISTMPVSDANNCFFSTTAANYELIHKNGDVWTFQPFPAATTVRIRGGCLYFLTEIRDARGRTLTIQRGSNGALSRITSSSGRYVQFFYNSSGVVSRITDSTGRSVDYTYEPLSELGTANGLGGFGGLRLSSGTTGGASAGAVIGLPTAARRPLNRISSVQTPDGTYSYEYEDDPPDFRLGGPKFAVAGSSAVASSNLGTGSVGPCSMALGGTRISRVELPGIPGAIENVHGPSHRVHQQRWPDGTVRNFKYEILGACVYNTATPEQRCSDSSCPTTDSPETAAAGWRFVGGRVLSTTVSDSIGVKYTQRFNNNRIALDHTDALGRVWRFDRDNNNRISRMTDPLGRTTRYFYDAHGNTTRVIDPAGRVIEMDYATTGAHRLTFLRRYRQDGSFLSIQLGHDPNSGNLTSLRDQLGRTTELGFDPTTELLTSVRTPGGRITRMAYDANGDLTRVTNPLDQTDRMEYDGAGRLSRTIDALGQGTQYTYNDRDQITQVINANGHATRINYDTNNRIASIVDPLDQATDRFEYTPASQVQAMADTFSLSTLYRYDARNRLVEATDRRGQIVTLNYDAADQLVEAVRVDGRTQYRYDVVGRLIEIEESGTTSGRIALEYDVADRVVRETHQQNELFVSIENVWDDLDRRIQRRVSASGPDGSLPAQVTDYQYDNAGRLVRISQSGRDTLYQWDEDDRLTQKTLPNGIIATYAYDDANRANTTTYRRTDGTVIEQLSYQYDASGRRVRRDALITPSVPETPFVAQYTNSRMTEITLDPTGASPRTYALSYDSSGNLTSKVNVDDATDRTDYIWDSRDRLFQLTAPGYTSSFEYDSQDRRIARRISRAGQADVVTYFVYDGLQAVGEIQPSHGQTPQQNSDLLSGLLVDELIGRTIRSTAGEQQQALLTDALGSVLALTLDDQSLLSVHGFSPYGESDDPALTDSAGYTGREQDGTGLHFYRARYYDPVLKRFISEDPVGLAAGTNRYAYVEGNPVSYMDPLGLWRWGDPLPQGLVDFAAGFGDTLSFGVTNQVRELAGLNGVVDKCSRAYGGGELAGTGLSLAFGGAHLGRGAMNQGLKRVFSDSRKWGTVQRTWSRNVGGYKGKYELHHWFTPQSAGGSNAAWNYMAVSPSLNRLMSNGGWAFNTFRGSVLGMYAVAPVSAASGLLDDCGCGK